MFPRAQVLKLVHYLVRYGHYANDEAMKELLEPLLSLLDSRNDKYCSDHTSMYYIYIQDK